MVFCAFHKNRTVSCGGYRPVAAFSGYRLTAVRRTYCRTVHRPRRARRTAGRSCGQAGRAVPGQLLLPPPWGFVVHLGASAGVRVPSGGYLLLNGIDHLDVFIYQRLVLLLALGKTVHQCTQLTLCLEQLALLVDQQRLRLALSARSMAAFLPFSAYSRPIALILLKSIKDTSLILAAFSADCGAQCAIPESYSHYSAALWQLQRMHRNFYSLVPVWKQILRIFHLSGAAAVELAQHTVGGQQFQRQRIHLLEAAGGLVPQLGVVASSVN